MAYSQVYHPLPSFLAPFGSIGEVKAVREQGIQVQLSPSFNNDTKRNFSVCSLSSYLSFTPLNLSFISFSFACVFGILGGVFLALYAPWRIGTYLDLPASYCTVLSLDRNVVVGYLDLAGKHHTRVLSDDSEWYWQRNSTFACVYDGDFVIDKKTLEINYAASQSRWYLGFFINSCVFIFAGLIAYPLMKFVERKNVTFRYPSTVCNEKLAIPDWGKLGPYICSLLTSYYSVEGLSKMETEFHKYSTKYWGTRFIDLLPLLFLALTSGTTIGISVTFLYGFSFPYLCISILYMEAGICSMLAIACALFLFGIPENLVETAELRIKYFVVFGNMMGTITKKYSSEV